MAAETAFIGFGSNQGDRQEYCDRAVALMGLLPSSQLLTVSSYYETRPVGDERLLGSTWFYNGVVKLETQLDVRALHAICQETERALGRDDDQRDGPRTMDLDILFFGQQCLTHPDLHVPHPRLHLRRFVLEPLRELDPSWHHPVLKQTVQSLYEQLDDPSEVRRLDCAPGSRYGTRPQCSSTPPSSE